MTKNMMSSTRGDRYGRPVHAGHVVVACLHSGKDMEVPEECGWRGSGARHSEKGGKKVTI